MTHSPPPPSDGSAGKPRFRDVAIASGLLTKDQIDAAEAALRKGPYAALERTDPLAWDKTLAGQAVEKKWITKFQGRELLAGRRRFTLGQYLVLDEIGRGGMGQVFKAEHAMMGRIVALKVLPRAKSTPETEAAFQREIRMLARLDHDNLVRALDAGHDGNVHYLVTEYVPGLDLRRQVLKHGPLDEHRAVSVIVQAARALAYAHDQGLVHRDVKPGNLIVHREGRVKLLDLGLAGSVFEAESLRLGKCVGTMDYMAPEQIRSPDTVGPTADIYSLGCTLYFAVSGRVPFPGGERKDKARRHLHEQPPSVRSLAPNVSAGLARAVEAMMEKSPEDRIATAAEVIGLLRPWTPAGLLPMPRHPLTGGATVRDGITGSVSSEKLTPGISGSSGFALGDPHGSDSQPPLDIVRDAGLHGTSVGNDRSGRTLWPDEWPQPPRTGRLAAIVGEGRVAVAACWHALLPVLFAIGRTLAWLVKAVDAGHLAKSVVQGLVVAAPVGVAFGVMIHAVSQINPDVARRILGGASPRSLGWTAFVLMMAVQFIASFGNSRGRRG